MLKIQSRSITKKIIFISMGMGVFLLPLLHAWMQFPIGIESVQARYAALGGLLPWSDANAYFQGASSLISTGELDAWNTRRPLNAILFSMRLWVADHDFKIALLIQALLCGFSCLLVVSKISKTFGKIAGAITLLPLFVFAAVFIPTTLSEALGLTLGCLGFTILWEGVTSKRLSLLFGAGLILTIGLNARAGAFFVLPLLMIWLGFALKYISKGSSFNWRASAAMALGVLAGFTFSLLLPLLYGDPQAGTAHSNFSLTLYGLVSGGKSWNYAYTVFPELSILAEAQIAKFLYIKSFEVFISNPFLLIVGISKNFLDLMQYGISFFQHVISNPYIKFLSRVIGFVLVCIGLMRFKTLYKKYPMEFGLLGVGLLGMFLSAGVIWIDGGMRLFAATIPFVAATIGCVAASFISKFPVQAISGGYNISKNNFETNSAIFLSSLLLILGVLWPVIIRINTTIQSSVPFMTMSCQSNETPMIIKKISGAPHIPLVPPAAQFRKNIVNSVIEDKQSFLRILDPDILTKALSLGNVYDLNSKRSKYIIGPSEIFSATHTFIGLCTKKIPGTDTIVEVKTFGALNEQ